MDFQTVYEIAVAKSAQAREIREALLETPEQFIEKVNKARLKLFESILEAAQYKIIDAAEKGYSTVDLYTFNGNDFLDDVSVLFLLKGPRPYTPPVPEGTPGPLLDDLTVAMAPFQIVHDWDGISGGNRVIARWA
jgi:hypothetical protein